MTGRVLFLGRADSAVLAHLRVTEPDVVALGPDVELTPDVLGDLGPSWVVVHGYRRLLRPPLLEALPGRFVNCHIALLPFNRGSDPTLWSVLDGTPAGVTVHVVDEGLDTGPVLAQREVPIGDDDTLATAYERLQAEMAALFAETWPHVVAGEARAVPQRGPATAHRTADRREVEHLLPEGWDTRVGALRAARRRR